MRKLIFILLIVGILTGCAPYCDQKEVETAKTEIDRIYKEYDHWIGNANPDDPGNQSRIIYYLEDYRKELGSVKVPLCLTAFKLKMLDSMKYQIDAINYLYSGQTISAKLSMNISQIDIDTATSIYENIQKCLPNCLPQTP